MRGISLPIETTIVLILAAIVLVALLFFFSGTFNPSVERIKLEQQKVNLCTEYVSVDSECSDKGVGKVYTVKGSKILVDLADLGKKLGYSKCDTPGATAECVQQICTTYCPQPTPVATPTPTP